MAAYLVASYTITDPEGYAPYPAAVAPTLVPFGGKLVSADFTSDVLEGQPHPVTIVVEFPSKEAAHDWYNSPAYQEVLPLRRNHTEGVAVIVAGA